MHHRYISKPYASADLWPEWLEMLRFGKVSVEVRQVLLSGGNT
jgi:hypothetical protein